MIQGSLFFVLEHRKVNELIDHKTAGQQHQGNDADNGVRQDQQLRATAGPHIEIHGSIKLAMDLPQLQNESPRTHTGCHKTKRHDDKNDALSHTMNLAVGLHC
jgi:hypothetical protein